MNTTFIPFEKIAWRDAQLKKDLAELLAAKRYSNSGILRDVNSTADALNILSVKTYDKRKSYYLAYIGDVLIGIVGTKHSSVKHRRVEVIFTLTEEAAADAEVTVIKDFMAWLQTSGFNRRSIRCESGNWKLITMMTKCRLNKEATLKEYYLDAKTGKYLDADIFTAGNLK